MKVLNGKEALDRVIEERPDAVLDVGSGVGRHAKIMRAAGLEVTTLDSVAKADVRGDYERFSVVLKFPAIWCCHTLEHARNVGAFLDKLYRDLEPGGLLALTVPPMRKKLVSGHVNQFSEGTLVYQLILAGFDCSEARVGVYRYNVSVLVRKVPAELPNITRGVGDLELLARFFPWPVHQGIDSRLGRVRW